jgi:hypothetical protein
MCRMEGKSDKVSTLGIQNNKTGSRKLIATLAKLNTLRTIESDG